MTYSKTDSNQRGAALMAMVTIIFIAGSAVVFSAVRPPLGGQDHDENTSRELAEAKQALIAYAANYGNINVSDDGPGRLPCPDSANTGEPAATCNWSAAYRLPEYIDLPSGNRFPINDHYAGIDRQFWYAISPDYRHNNPGSTLNNTTVEGLTLDGNPVVAVIFSPGGELNAQSRPSLDLAGSDHLEGGNEVVASASYISIDPDPNDLVEFNDRAVAISRSELMSPVTALVAKEINDFINVFYEHEAYGDYPSTWNDIVNRRTQLNDWWDCCSGFFPFLGWSVPPTYDYPNWFYNDIWEDSSRVDTFNRLDTTVVTFKFLNCDIVYTVDYDNGLSRSTSKC